MNKSVIDDLEVSILVDVIDFLCAKTTLSNKRSGKLGQVEWSKKFYDNQEWVKCIRKPSFRLVRFVRPIERKWMVKHEIIDGNRN